MHGRAPLASVVLCDVLTLSEYLQAAANGSPLPVYHNLLASFRQINLVRCSVANIQSRLATTHCRDSNETPTCEWGHRGSRLPSHVQS